MSNIAIISKSDSTGGGASRIAASLARLLNDLPEYEAHHWVGRPGINADWFTYKLHGGQWLSLIQGVCAIGSRTIGLPDFLTPELFIHLQRKSVNYDLYHFHDISFTFSPIALKWLAMRKPIIWTMHDCSPFTGGCIAPLDCQAVYSGCNKCPQLNKLPLGTKIDFTGAMQNFKIKLLGDYPIVIIVPSQWLAKEAIKVVNFKVKPIVIPNFVDTAIFKPLDKNIVREILGLPKDRFIVLLTATNLSDKHKGNYYAVEALKQLKSKPLIIAIGKLDEHQNIFFKGLEVVTTGYIYNDQLLAQYYACANIFLYPTLADTFGCVAIEAMACGTPAIAFSTGGVPEIIDHDQNGWLVKPKDTQGLAAGLEIAINEPLRLKSWGKNARLKAEKHFNRDLFINRHLALYDKVLSKL
ncbi:glycosyltransferase [Crenothrix polyspora]|uniref:Glycosyl transferase group 1 n=1 Tax=Crenothrix polyspora TaxID=360316 RepID=A0A1R4HCQ9_9GAMM|nr:glycosyltransferase [Crenothrix polyspora]SJM94025.1 Glycosyl transferase group 1 [Crenothrix polyspora]